MKRAGEKTGKGAASQAAKVLHNPNASTAAKSAAGSALTQRRSNEVTGVKAASAVGKTLSNPSASKSAKSAAASALTQREGRGRR